MKKIFDFYKTTYNDVRSRGGKVVLVSYSDLVTQYQDRNVDILVPNLAVPGAAVQEASLARKMKILPMEEGLLKYGVGTPVQADSSLARSSGSRCVHPIFTNPCMDTLMSAYTCPGSAIAKSLLSVN